MPVGSAAFLCEKCAFRLQVRFSAYVILVDFLCFFNKGFWKFSIASHFLNIALSLV